MIKSTPVADSAISPQTLTFLDYHRTVVAYHGTTAKTADKLVNGEPFNPSQNDDDWFGPGVYFWEYAPRQAWWWAQRCRRKAEPAVVGAMIRLGNCLDLLDPENVAALRGFQQGAVVKWRASGKKIPRNGNQHKKLDCAIFRLLYKQQKNPTIDTARAVYVPMASSQRAWKRSWIYAQAHIQICVQNPANILAVWRVRRDGRYGKDESPS